MPSPQREIDDIRDLGAPSDDGDEVKPILDEGQAALNKVKSDPALLATQEQHDPFAKTNQLARSYALRACGEGG